MERKLFELKRYLDMLQNLRYDIKRSINYEMYSGTGRLAVQSYNVIQQGIVAATDDDFVRAMTLDINEDMTEKERIWLVNMAAGQLIGYTEGLMELVKLELESRNPEKNPVEQARDTLRSVFRDEE